MKLAVNRRLIIFIIVTLGILTPIAVDEYAPSLPAMVHDLQSSVPQMQLTFTFFLFALGIGQVIMGPLSDRFGRKPILQTGIVIFLLGTLLCIFATNAALLLAGRAIQGLGIASAAMTTTAVIGDIFEGNDINKVTGYFVLVYGLIPIIGPVLGGYLQDTFGWQANFIFMFVFVLLAFFLYWAKLPESHIPTEENKIHPRRLLRAYRDIFSNKTYISAVTGGMLSWAMIITFSIVAPFLIQNVLGYSATIYGYIALSVGLGFFVGNIINTRLISKNISAKQLLFLGLITALIPSFIFLLLTLFSVFNVWVIIVPTFIIMLGIGFTFPNYYGIAVGEFTTKHTGIANALIGALILFGTVIYSIILTQLHAHSPITLGSVYSGMSILNLLIFLIVIYEKRAKK